MAPPIQHGSLQIEEDMAFQRREWIVQWVGRALLAVALLAAVLGLFGRGPLSNRRSASGDGTLSVEYQRFWRFEAPCEMRFDFAPGTATEGKVRLALDRAWVDAVEVQDVDPEPEKVEASGARIIYSFAVADAQSPSGVVVRYKPEKAGTQRSEARLGEKSAVAIRQFVFP